MNVSVGEPVSVFGCEGLRMLVKMQRGSDGSHPVGVAVPVRCLSVSWAAL